MATTGCLPGVFECFPWVRGTAEGEGMGGDWDGMGRTWDLWELNGGRGEEGGLVIGGGG